MATDDVPVVTDDGRRLSRIWSEADLLVAECLRAGAWRGLTPTELAATASTLVFEARRDNPALPAIPAGKVASAIGEMRRIRLRLHDVEADHGVRVTRDLDDLGFAWAAYRWADGQSLDRVLAPAEQAGTELSGGDFVRWARPAHRPPGPDRQGRRGARGVGGPGARWAGCAAVWSRSPSAAEPAIRRVPPGAGVGHNSDAPTGCRGRPNREPRTT